jgi:hypothetical protein
MELRFLFGLGEFEKGLEPKTEFMGILNSPFRVSTPANSLYYGLSVKLPYNNIYIVL